MKFEIEKYVFDRAWDMFDGTYFISHIADTGWPDFFKVENEEIWLCKTEKVGWCNDGPGETVEKLEHVSVVFDTKYTCALVFDGEKRQLRQSKEPVRHYYGR